MCKASLECVSLQYCVHVRCQFVCCLDGCVDRVKTGRVRLSSQVVSKSLVCRLST